jgi:hypothetical protein
MDAPGARSGEVRARLACIVLAGSGVAHAEAPILPSFDHAPPCEHPVTDPVVTSLRDGRLDAQRSACMRQALSVGVDSAVLIDTPGFHGLISGGLVLGASMIVKKAHELSAELGVIDTTFVQNAVNKVTHVGFGPLVVGAAAGKPIGTAANAAISLRVEAPATRETTDTMHTGAELAGLVSGMLASRLVLHGRLAALGTVASSLGGTTKQLAFIAGIDLAWHPRQTVALDLGADMMSGWQSSIDHLLVRTGVHWRPRGYAWRLRVGAGIPVAGAERTNAVVDVTFLVDR